MKELELITKIQVVSYEELSEGDRQLIDAAKEATKGSYAPYSKFKVGAAILLANSKIVSGANQENVAFPSGTCGERSACFYASAKYPGIAFKKIAVAAYSNGAFQRQPISPCGACRQALLEYENMYGDIEVLLYGEEAIYIVPSVKNLLPLCFSEF